MGTAPQLRYCILELGLRCNLRCLHCASGSGDPRRDELTEAEWVDVVRGLSALGRPAVDLMGGEVLLSPLLEPIGRALADAGLGWGLLSNGWLLDEGRASRLLDIGCRGVGISLDGASPATHDRLRGRAGAHEHALRALDVVAGLDLKPRNRAILTSVNRANIDELEALGDLLEDRFPAFRWQINLSSANAPRLPPALRLDAAGVDRVARFIDRRRRAGGHLIVSASHDVGHFAPALDLHDYTWSGCPAGIANLGIQSDGTVKGCLALDERFALGNVRERPIEEIWRDEGRMRLHRGFTVADLGPSCRECVWGTRCRGGCGAASSAATGRLHDHPFCLWRASDAPRRESVRTAVVVHSPSSWPLPDESAGTPAAPPALTPLVDAQGDWRAPLRSLCVELTLRCNLACQHCGSAAGRARDRELDLADFLAVFRDLRELGGERVVLLGGEPLLHADWPEIALMARAFGLAAALITNGVTVTDQTAARMVASGIERAGVSIDGASDRVHDGLRGVPGARRRTWIGLERLRAAGLPVTVITTVCRTNLAELPGLGDQLAATGGLVWQIQAANGTGERFLRDQMLDGPELLGVARFVHDLRRSVAPEVLTVAVGHNIGHHASTVHDYSTVGEWRGCPGGLTSAGLTSDGDLKGCLSMSACEVVDSIRRRSLAEIWRDPTSFARNRAFRPALLQAGCARCPHGADCRGGCPEMARTATGHVHDNPLCLRQVEGRL